MTEPPARPLDLFDLGAPAFTTFTARDGVPESVINDVTTDADGFAWIATRDGLARYDGQRWEPLARRIVAGQVTDFFLDRSKTLWVTLFDKGVALYDGKSWRKEDGGNGLPTERIRRVHATRDRSGRVETWALTMDAGLLRRHDGGWRADPGNAQLPRGMLIAIARTTELGGAPRLWVGTLNDGVWFREDGGVWQRLQIPGFDPAQVEDLLLTRRGGREELWIGTFGLGLWRLTDRGLTSWTVQSGDLQSNEVYRLEATSLPDGQRVVWAATRSGLVRVHGDKVRVFDRRHGLPSNAVRNLHVWRSPTGVDVLWIATEAGVARTVVGATPWQTASLMGSRAIGVFDVLIEPDGQGGERLWVASSQDGLGLYENGRWSTFGEASGALPTSDLRVVTRAPDETGRQVLWVGCTGGELVRGEEGPRFTRVATPWPKHPAEAVMDILARTDEGRRELWVATRQSGVHRFRQGRWTAFRPATALGPWRTVKLAEQITGDGRSWLWVTSNQGLARFDGERWTLLGSEAGLPDPDLLGLTLLQEGQGRAVLWAGSRRSGIVRVDVSNPLAPRVLPSDEIPRPPDPTVYGAQRDSKGRVYVCSNNGVQQLVPDPSGGYDQRTFGRRDGLVHEECNTNGQRIDDQDRYWVGTLGGLAVYDPGAVPRDRRARPLKLTHTRIDGVEVPADALRVPPRTRELRFDFVLLAWQREGESRFRSQLLGYDPRPTPWTPQSYRVFGTLPPGHYTLRIEGRDYAGLQGPPLEVPVEVLPDWWQRLGFRIAVFGFFAVAGPLFYLYRVRRFSAQKAELERLVTERTAALAAANERLAHLSQEDALTGVANRRRLDQALDEEWRRAVRMKTSLSFILLDVDHFKAYNDHLGHQAGDACLVSVARTVAEAHTRAGELVARYGGEEFAVLLPGVNREGARAQAEQVRRSVMGLALPHPSSGVGPVVTVSLGIASAEPTDRATPADLVRAADYALYEAKRGGRNCVRG